MERKETEAEGEREVEKSPGCIYVWYVIQIKA